MKKFLFLTVLFLFVGCEFHTNLGDRIAETEKRQEKTEREIEILRQEMNVKLENCHRIINENSKRIEYLADENDSNKNNIKKILAKIEELKETDETFKNELEENYTSIVNCEQELNKNNEEIKNLKNKLDEYEQELNDYKQKIEDDNNDSFYIEEISELNKKIEEIENSINDLNKANNNIICDEQSKTVIFFGDKNNSFIMAYNLYNGVAYYTSEHIIQKEKEINHYKFFHIIKPYSNSLKYTRYGAVSLCSRGYISNGSEDQYCLNCHNYHNEKCVSNYDFITIEEYNNFGCRKYCSYKNPKPAVNTSKNVVYPYVEYDRITGEPIIYSKEESLKKELTKIVREEQGADGISLLLIDYLYEWFGLDKYL